MIAHEPSDARRVDPAVPTDSVGPVMPAPPGLAAAYRKGEIAYRFRIVAFTVAEGEPVVLEECGPARARDLPGFEGFEEVDVVVAVLPLSEPPRVDRQIGWVVYSTGYATALVETEFGYAGPISSAGF
jgi:hypothetical protein